MIQIVYWGLELYSASVPEAKGAIDGLVAQSKALLLKEWRGCKRRISRSFELSSLANQEGITVDGNASTPGGSYAGSGRYVYENFGADTAEGYGYSSEAQPMCKPRPATVGHFSLIRPDPRAVATLRLRLIGHWTHFL